MTVDTPVESSTARVLKQCFGIRADKAASEALTRRCRLHATAGTSGVRILGAAERAGFRPI